MTAKSGKTTLWVLVPIDCTYDTPEALQAAKTALTQDLCPYRNTEHYGEDGCFSVRNSKKRKPLISGEVG